MGHAPIIGSKLPAGKQERAIIAQIEYHQTMSEHHPTKNSTPEHPELRQATVMLGDLTDDLLWPKLLRAPALALAPSRVLAGAICAFLLSVILQIATIAEPAEGEPPTGFFSELLAVTNGLERAINHLASSALELDPFGFASALQSSAIFLRQTVMHSPMVALLIGIPFIAILSIAGGAIARSCAIEFAHGRFAPSDDTLGFALRRARHFVLAVVGPVVLCATVLLIIALGGLLLSVPVLDVLGSILYAIALLLGIGVTLVLVLHVLALPMIVPALAVEGTDAFDAIQRSYAYVIAKPLRYLSYALLMLVLAVLAGTIFTMLAAAAIEMTDWAAAYFESESTIRALSGEGDQGATKATAHAIITIWRTIVSLAATGYAISLFFTSSTLLYLAVRRICDGQDINEIWEDSSN